MNIRETLINLGTPAVVVPVVEQYLYLLPETTDPDMQGTAYMIRAIQVGLRRLGHKVALSGVFDEATVRALNSVSLPAGSWRRKTWIQILNDVDDAVRNPRSRAVALRAGSGYTQQQGWFDDAKSFALGLAGSLVKWGFGTSKTVCVGADAAAKSVFLAVQRQANRLGGGIKEDGVIGPATVAAIQKLAGPAGMSPSTCADVANNAVLIGMRLKAEADRRGLPADAGKVAAQLSAEKPVGPIYESKESLDAMAKRSLGMSPGVGTYLAVGVAAAGVGWLVFRRRKAA